MTIDDPLDRLIEQGLMAPPPNDWSWYVEQAKNASEDVRDMRLFAISPATIMAVDAFYAEVVAIVREIADGGDVTESDEHFADHYCVYCGERLYETPEGGGHVFNQGDHAADCLLIRARRLVAAMEGTDGG